MSMGNSVTLVGNLTSDPQLRYLDSGNCLASFVLALTERVFDKTSGQWRDGESTFIRSTVWKSAGAENVAESLTKGSRVVVTGELKQHSYTTDNGEKRSVIDLKVDEIGASLRFSTAKVTKGNRPQSAPAPQADNPWATSVGAGAQPF